MSLDNGHNGIMVFRPTLEEFKDFSGYIQKMEESGAHKFGIAKVGCIKDKPWRDFCQISYFVEVFRLSR